MRGGNFFMCTLELLLLLCLTLEHLEAKPRKHYGRCKFLDDEQAVCRLHNDCNTFSNNEKTDEQFLKKHSCSGEVDGKPLVCCPEKPTDLQLIDEVFETPKAAVELPLPPQCGKMLKDRIFYGHMTSLDEFPWMALIETTKASGEKQYVCGGVLITKRWVLTAAHCHDEADGIITGVRLGEWDTSTERDCVVDRNNHEECLPPYINVQVDRVKSHPGYSKTTNLDDIALLRLAHLVLFTNNIKTICLPHTQKQRNDYYENAAADICGWGRTETEQISTVKLKATLNIWQRERCRTGLNRLGVQLDERLLCASGANNVSSCYGDSGGPLMFEYEGTSFYVVGVISRGVKGCRRSDTPIVFTRVATYIDWIKETLANEQ